MTRTTYQDVSDERMSNAVDRIRERLLRAAAALDAGSVAPRLLAAALVTVSIVAAACHQKRAVQRVVPGISTGAFTELSESDLAAHVICHDTLGRRPERVTRQFPVTRCTPCIPYGMRASVERSVAHARRLWRGHEGGAQWIGVGW